MDLSFDLKFRRGFLRPFATGSLLLLTTAAAIEMIGCSTRRESNYSAANANAPISTNTATNTATNTMSNSRQENTAVPNNVVDVNMLQDELKKRLKHDNEHFMPDGGWNSDAWLDTNVGAFYKNDDEMAKLMVCDITDRLLKTVSKKLKPFARQKLYDGVSGNTKCRAAVNLMFKATLNTSPMNPVP
ncbi:MAG TPA: hypothetical protein VGJ02_00850 [Pyrinomonadaceae bacterium]|jgi:hypothetical protein